MRIFWFIATEAFLLSIVFAKTEDPKRLEDLTTKESISSSKVNSSGEETFSNQQTQDTEKIRNVRHTENILSPIFADPHWPTIESPIFFDTSLQDKEKTKLVLIEPFFRAKKVEKGFWGWLKKIFGDNNKDKEKIGQGPLIGPVKVPGMGDNVYIRAADSENEANHVVIHLMIKNPLEKEIKFESHLPLINFDTIHELPGESSSYQTIVSPHFSHEGLFDKSHFPGVVATEWSSVPSSSIHIPSVKENFYANPSFFRKHSTVSEGSELSATPTKEVDEAQQFTAWAQTQQYGSPGENYGNLGQVSFYGSEDNRQFSSAREDINNLQRTQNSGLEISENKETLPLYPPLFNSSFGLDNSNNKNMIYVTNNRDTGNQKSSSGPKRESQPYPGLGAYKTEFKIPTLLENITHSFPQEEFISQVGIQEVEAPNLTQAENRGIYQFQEIDNDKLKIENSKKIRNSQSSDYGNYGLTDSNNSNDTIDSNSSTNETDEALKTISASYPWEYQIPRDKFTTLKPNISQINSKSKHSIDDVKKNTRFRSRNRNRNRGAPNQEEKENFQSKIKKEIKEFSENGKIEEEKKEDELEKPLTAEKVKEFFIKESKRFEEVLKTVENESKAIEEETKEVTSESKSDKNESKIESEKVEDDQNQESKTDKKESESRELENKKENEEKKEKKEEEENKEKLAIEENSKIIKEELDAVKKDLKAVKQELEISREKLKNKNTFPSNGEISQNNTTNEQTKDLKVNTENLNLNQKLKSMRKIPKIEEKTKSTKKETISDKLKNLEDDIPLKMLFNTREKLPQEKEISEIKEDEEHKEREKINQSTDAPETVNNSRFRKINREMKKYNKTNRFDLKKPKISILDPRFKNKLQNRTIAEKANNSTGKIEISSIITTTPRSHITRIYGKNRAAEKLKLKAKKEKIAESEENKKNNNNSKESLLKLEKPKIRISKFTPRTRNFKAKATNSSDEIKTEK